MIGLWAGVAGFVIAIAMDFLSARRWWILARLGFWSAIVLFIFAIYKAAFKAARFDMPEILTFTGWVLLPLSFGLLVYSLFIELPLFSTYIRKSQQPALITTGTYALTRHPGLLWFGLMLLAILLVSRSRELLLAAPIWFGLDVLWVALQDRFIFTRVFNQYRSYQRETPMLFPSYKSLKRCLATLGKERK